MQSLAPNEVKQLKSQFNALMEASVCLINRDEIDASHLSEQRQHRMRAAINTLRLEIPQAIRNTKKSRQNATSDQLASIQATLRQLSKQLGSELRATLREADKDARSVAPTADIDKVRRIAATLGSQEPGSAMHVFLQHLTNALQLTQSIQTDVSKDMLVPGLDHGNQAIQRSRHENLQHCLSGLLPLESDARDVEAKRAALEKMTPEEKKQLDQFIRWTQHIERQLQLSLDLYDDYQSPGSIESICHARQCDVKAALNVLRQDPANQHQPFIELLEKRYEALEQIKLEPGKFDALKLLGEKEISGGGRLLHPIDTARQAIRLDQALSRLMAIAHQPDGQVLPRSLELDGFSEPMLMRALLKKAGITDAMAKHRQAYSEVLDHQDWHVIRSDIVVPVESDMGVSFQRMQSVTTPASHVLANPERVSHAESNLILNTARSADYLHENGDGKPVRGGFNSHDLAESNHALMVAHDELYADSQRLFGATRHAVHAPFGLPDQLKSMPSEAAGELVAQLVGPTDRPPNIETIQYPGVTLDTGSADEPTMRIQNQIAVGFRERLQVQLDNERALVAGLNESGLSPNSLSDASYSVDALLSDPTLASELARRVREDPVLMKLIVRQGALNRAREAIVMEIARDPAFAAKIAAGETLLFNSISLVTPDHLRHFIASMSGSAVSFDEKSMLEIQVQAYKDLQQEIADGGLVVNGKPVHAKILVFNWGVNELSLLKPGNDPVIGSLINGHDVSNDLCNQDSLIELVGLPDEAPDSTMQNETEKFLVSTSRRLSELESLTQTTETAKEINRLREALQVVPQLRDQIRQIWADGSYRFAGNEPYKMPARLALLSFYLGGGTLFNCKSGKDRTGQLSVEVKLLVTRIRANQGRVPQPDQAFTTIEKIQYGAITFLDKTRTELQRYATGYAGSKLGAARQLLKNLFALTDQLKGQALAQLNRDRFREFIGLSKRTKA
ncbi:MAG: hypothetical protein RL369_91 [Pseudomonadota bacterium]